MMYLGSTSQRTHHPRLRGSSSGACSALRRPSRRADDAAAVRGSPPPPPRRCLAAWALRVPPASVSRFLLASTYWAAYVTWAADVAYKKNSLDWNAICKHPKIQTPWNSFIHFDLSCVAQLDIYGILLKNMPSF